MELPSIIAVTKADLEKISMRTISDIEGAMSLMKEMRHEWKMPILLISAFAEKNIKQLCTEFENHFCYLEKNNLLHAQRERQHYEWIKDHVSRRLGSFGLSQLENLPEFSFDTTIPFFSYERSRIYYHSRFYRNEKLIIFCNFNNFPTCHQYNHSTCNSYYVKIRIYLLGIFLNTFFAWFHVTFPINYD